MTIKAALMAIIMLSSFPGTNTFQTMPQHVINLVPIDQESIKVYSKFEADIDMLPKNKSGRKTPFYNNFRVQFKIGSIKVDGTIILPDTIQMIRAGDKKRVSIKLTSAVELKKGSSFDIYEVGRKIGSGEVVAF